MRAFVLGWFLVFLLLLVLQMMLLRFSDKVEMARERIRVRRRARRRRRPSFRNFEEVRIRRRRQARLEIMHLLERIARCPLRLLVSCSCCCRMCFRMMVEQGGVVCKRIRIR